MADSHSTHGQGSSLIARQIPARGLHIRHSATDVWTSELGTNVVRLALFTRVIPHHFLNSKCRCTFGLQTQLWKHKANVYRTHVIPSFRQRSLNSFIEVWCHKVSTWKRSSRSVWLENKKNQWFQSLQTSYSILMRYSLAKKNLYLVSVQFVCKYYTEEIDS